ncbi:unnamed protein product [Pleuronectes platessa]|uniref:Uncharacterized protein n=1 Tax=Pleuronectes platessa TaxID=8262 RepID=A0A9N7UEH1_PLEPL|nr:unnamed protein product [Pleuronectes platessa]
MNSPSLLCVEVELSQRWANNEDCCQQDFVGVLGGGPHWEAQDLMGLVSSPSSLPAPMGQVFPGCPGLNSRAKGKKNKQSPAPGCLRHTAAESHSTWKKCNEPMVMPPVGEEAGKNLRGGAVHEVFISSGGLC